MYIIKIPATTANLGAGYDVMGMALAYYNYVQVEEGDFAIQIEGNGAKTLSLTGSNLIYRAAEAAFELAGKPMPKLKFILTNNIPLARGMGSSSVAIVGGIMAANAVMDGAIDDDALLDLAVRLEGHPDNVAPTFFGGFVVCAKEKDKYYYHKNIISDDLKAIIAVPDFLMPTKLSRSVLPDKVPVKDAVYNISHAVMVALALAEGDLALFGTMLNDRIHQHHRFGLIKGAADVVKAALSAGAIGCVLSGAGSSMVAFADAKVMDDAQISAIGDNMRNAFAKNGIESYVIVTGIDNYGARVE